MTSVLTQTSGETAALGEKIGRFLANADLFAHLAVALTGDLGTGKTTLVQGMALGLGVDPGYYITSPTFNIINEYPAGSLRLCHLDLYRLGSADELDYIGFEDLLTPNTVLAVEWPDLLRDTGFSFDLEIRLAFDPAFNRKISLLPSGQQGQNLLSSLFP